MTETLLPDRFGSPALRSVAPENLILAELVDSTNRLVARIARDYLDEAVAPPDLLMIALEQTAGRGRRGRSWASPKGRGIYLSRLVFLGEGQSPKDLPMLVPLWLARALERWLPAGGCRIKWPNDLLVGGRKIGGILLETISRGSAGGRALVLGAGINHDLRDGRQDVPQRGTSLCDEADEAPSYGEVLTAIVDELEAGLEAWRNGRPSRDELVDLYRAASAHRPGDRIRCQVGAREVVGDLMDFDDRGHLLLRGDDGEEIRVASGELIEPLPEVPPSSGSD